MNSLYTEGLARALFEEAGDALFLFEPESDELLDVNRTAERMSGFGRPEAPARLEGAEAELRRVLSSVSDCLWSAEVDADGRWSYRYCSPVVARVTGRPAEYFLQGPSRWKEVVHPDDRPRWERWLARL